MMATALLSPDATPSAMIETRTLKAALRTLAGARDRGTFLPLQQIRVTAAPSGLTLTAQTLQTVIRVVVPADAADGLDLLLPWDTALNVARLPGRVTLADGVASGAAVLRWAGLALRDWPTAPTIHADAALAAPVAATVDATQLAADLRVLVVTAARDQSRPILRGIRVDEAGPDGTLLVSTDGTRLARVPLGLTALPGHVAAIEAVDALAAALGTRPTGGVTWQVADGWDAWTWGPVTVAGESLTGKYPDYRRVLPDTYPVAVTMDRDAWMAALKPLVALARQDRAGSIAVQWGADGLTLRADAMDVGTAQTVIPGTGGPSAPVWASFDPRMLADVPKGFGPGPITFAWSGREAPAAATQSGRLHIVLPLRQMA